MRRISRRWPLAVVVVLVLGVAADTSAATTLALSETTFRSEFRSLEFTAGTNQVRCPVTLEGSFQSATFAKTAEARIGMVSRASLAGGSCTGGGATILNATLPWVVAYSSFGGTLPTIRTVTEHLVGAALSIQPTGSLMCLASSEGSRPIRMTAELVGRGEVSSLTLEESLPLRGSLGACLFAGEMLVRGVGTFTVLNETSEVLVFLAERTIVLENNNEGALAPLNIERREETSGSRPLRNLLNVPQEIKAVFFFGENERLFAIREEEAGACRIGRALAKRPASCNIVVEYIGPPIPRVMRTSTRINITTRVGKATLNHNEFAVNAN